MNYSITFELPGLPKTVNAQNSMHWRDKGTYVKEWHRMVHLSVARQKPEQPLKRASLILTRFSSTEPDFDGLVSSFKCVVDALIVAGIIENDKMSNIGKPDYRWQRVAPKAGKIQVTVQSVEDAK